MGHHIFSTRELKKLKVEFAVPNKYLHLPQGRLTEIPKGEGVSKLNWNFQGTGGGAKLKKFPWVGYRYFLKQLNMPNNAISQYLNKAAYFAQDWLSVFLCVCF